MASPRQIAANRLNARKSTGPRTLAGNRRSRRNALRHGLTAETLIETYKDIIALDYAETFLKRAIRQAQTALSHSLNRSALEQQYVEALKGSAQEAQRQLAAEKQAAHVKLRSVSSMTQDLQMLERQLWTSMPSTIKAMLDFSANSTARGS